MDVSGRHAPAAVPPGTDPGTQYVTTRVGGRPGLPPTTRQDNIRVT